MWVGLKWPYASIYPHPTESNKPKGSAVRSAKRKRRVLSARSSLTGMPGQTNWRSSFSSQSPSSQIPDNALCYD